MAVYVDDMQSRARVGRLDAVWSHLQADTTAELHAFAARLGLRRGWVQHADKPTEHYDLTDSKRQLALRLGAVPITYMGADSMDLLRRKTAAFKATGNADLTAPGAPAAPPVQPPATPSAPSVPSVSPRPQPTQAPTTVTALPQSSSGMGFVALDFETANHDRASVCALGAVRVVDGVVTDRLETFVAPPARLATFHPVHRRVHGIDASMVRGAPDWQQACSRLVSFADGALIIAHNLPFERSVLMAACADAAFPAPDLHGLCTLALARKALPQLGSHKLPLVLEHLGIEFGQHHNAADDAQGAADVLLGLARLHNCTDPLALAARLRVPVRELR